MTSFEELRKQPFNIKLASVLISLIAIGFLVIQGKELLSPLLFSCLFSIILLPVANFLQFRCRLSRGLAAMIAVLLLLFVIGMVLYTVGAQLSNLGDDWPLFKDQMLSSVNSLQEWVTAKFHITHSKQLNYVKTATSNLMDSGTTLVGETLISLSSTLLFLVFTFIYTFLFLVYRSLIMKFFVAVFLEENKSVVHDIVEQVQFIIRRYITGLLLEMSIIATSVAAIFSMMGIKYAILLGIITGLFNLIPYIGIFTALVISTLITFATAVVAGKVALVIITLVVVHLIDSNILLPLIVGSKVKINALITLVGVILGEMIWGITGMFLSIPVIAVLKVIFDRIESLKPWGILLGDEEAKKKARKAKKVIEEIEGS